jgi:hypothetical protein
MGQFCTNCGASLKPDDQFCNACGMRTQAIKLPPKDNPYEVEQNQKELGLSGYLRDRSRAGLSSLQRLFKNPKQLIPVAVLSVSWLILAILPALGVNPLPVKIFSLLTFAQGGMFGGVWGAIGGVIGKAIYAYFISALIIPLVSGKKPFRRTGSNTGRGPADDKASAVSPLVIGLGLALVFYNFITGNANIINSMAGVVGLVLAIRSIMRKGGFLWGLLFLLVRNKSRAGAASQKIVSRIMTGYAIGSASGVALSAVPWPNHTLVAYIPYMIGGLMILIGLVLQIVIKPGKAVATA